jgi:hypothetical protein
VVLPQLRPALLAGWLVIALYVLGDFGVVALMRFEAFSYAIYLQYASAFDRTYAAWLSLILLALALGIVAAEGRLLGRRRYARVGSGAQRAVVILRLGAGRRSATPTWRSCCSPRSASRPWSWATGCCSHRRPWRPGRPSAGVRAHDRRRRAGGRS